MKVSIIIQYLYRSYFLGNKIRVGHNLVRFLPILVILEMYKHCFSIKYFHKSFTALGNHEGFPVGTFPTDAESGTSVSIEWLYNGVDNNWPNWDQDWDWEMFLKNGFYTTLIKPGLRLISLNTNFCSGHNIFLFLNFSDPADQLKWLTQQLTRSEQLGSFPLKKFKFNIF